MAYRCNLNQYVGMATKKVSKAEQYREIMAASGRRLEDCKVLAFEFEKETGPEIFHFDLMDLDRPIYYLFDYFGRMAQIVVPRRDTENERKCIAKAEAAGGRTVFPVLQ